MIDEVAIEAEFQEYLASQPATFTKWGRILYDYGETNIKLLHRLIETGNNDEQDLAVTYLKYFYHYTGHIHSASIDLVILAMQANFGLALKSGIAFLIEVLKHAPNRVIQDILISYLYVEIDYPLYIQGSIIDILGELKDEKAVPHIALFLDNDSELVTDCVIPALEAIASPAALFALHEWEKRNVTLG